MPLYSFTFILITFLCHLFFPETWCYTPYETPRLHCGDGHLCAAQMRNEGSSSSVCSNTPTARGWRKCKPRVARLGGRRDGQWDEGKSVSPGQPITSDPTPTKKGWRDERMDGDDDGGGGVGKKDESDKEEEQRHGKIQQYKNKEGEDILVGDAVFDKQHDSNGQL